MSGTGGGVWFTSDVHIGHRMVAELRGFEDVVEHDAKLASNWDRVVRPDDTVWFLGDLSVGGKAREREAIAWIAARHGRKHLVAGNHDSVHSLHRDAHKWQDEYRVAFDSIQTVARRRVLGQNVLLSHFPYAHDPEGDHQAENRYEQFRLPDMGEWLLHGHTHMASQRLHGRQIHVGVDAWGLMPVPLASVVELMESARSDS